MRPEKELYLMKILLGFDKWPKFAFNILLELQIPVLL
jgi:hypothetical protein